MNTATTNSPTHLYESLARLNKAFDDVSNEARGLVAILGDGNIEKTVGALEHIRAALNQNAMFSQINIGQTKEVPAKPERLV